MTQREGFLPVTPEFVIELKSPSDRISVLKQKMEDWISNGVEVGWLIDADRQVVWIYTQRGVRELHAPSTLIGDGPIAGFELPMQEIYRGLKF